MRYGRPRGWRPQPDEEDESNVAWKLLWVLAGAVTFTLIMFLLHLI